MKRFLIVIAAVLVAMTASARGKFGITGGVNFNTAKIESVATEPMAGWSAGLTYMIDLPLGFSIQPALVYTQSNASLSSDNVGFWDDIVPSELTQSVGALNLPVAVQWGPDLIVARPFVEVTPYVGYSLSNKLKGVAAGLTSTVDGKNTFDYGLGVGAGLNVWKLQAVVRYNWNFGAMGSLEDFTSINIGDLNADSPNYGGISVSLAFFF